MIIHNLIGVGIGIVLSSIAAYLAYHHQVILAYGDAESHINIAKRVVSGLTPGAAQLGGIWLPLGHLLLLPFVVIDPLWRTGLAGWIISATAYIIAGIYLYKTTSLLTHNQIAASLSALIFWLNPNVLYLQTTPMTEVTLICFFVASTYYFLHFLLNQQNIRSLVLAALMGFFASLTRYEGWLLVLIEIGIIILIHLRDIAARTTRQMLEGRLFLFSTLACFGIILWFLWDYLILGDPLYFTNSEFSAKSQQQAWLARGELPTYHNLLLSMTYYAFTSLENIGMGITLLALAGLITYGIALIQKKATLWLLLLLAVPFIFYVVSLYAGQAVIFIPSLTPSTFTWHLFNVRYGVMMVPVAAILAGYLYTQIQWRINKFFILTIFLVQIGLWYLPGSSLPVTLQDGISGLSRNKQTDAEVWLAAHYDHGMVLMDDYARTISVIRSGLPMKQVIYIGNKPYWEESLKNPEKYATWVIMQTNDAVWKALNTTPEAQAHLFTYYQKVYTSPDILIFKRTKDVVGVNTLTLYQNPY